MCTETYLKARTTNKSGTKVEGYNGGLRALSRVESKDRAPDQRFRG